MMVDAEDGGIDNNDLSGPPNDNEEASASAPMDVFMELLLEFQSVTGMEDIEESRRILEAHDWDLLAAISSHLGLESGSQQFSVAHLSRSRSSTSSPSPSPPLASNSPRIPNVPPHRNLPSSPSRNSRERGVGIFGFMYRLITRPFEWFFQYVWDFIGFGLRFIQADPRRAVTNPVDDVVNFIAHYESKYGNVHPVFYQGTYSQALTDAKKELKFLLVYLHCEEHGDTDDFCYRVMPNEGFRDLIRENMLFWACSVDKPEGYRTSQAMRENTYPFLALIVLKNNKMTIVSRVEGETNPEAVLTRLHQAVADNEAYLVAERQERHERSMTQTLRQQQDAAYLESLKADQEKEKRKKEEIERKLLEEQKQQQLIEEEHRKKEDLIRQKEIARETLRDEPPADHPDCVRILIKLPCGTRLERRFLKTDSLELLYQFVFGHPRSPNYFDIATNFPKRTLACKPTAENPNPSTFDEVGLRRNETLFVYDLES